MRSASLLALLLALGLALPAPAETGRRANPYRKLDIFSKVLSYVEREYVEDVQRRELIAGAIEGILGHLDPYSAYLTAAEVRQLKAQAAGEIGQTGLEAGLARLNPGEPVVVIAPVEGSPAWREGLAAGDRLLTVDGEGTGKLSLHHLAARLQGATGTTVRVEVDRPDWPGPKTFDLTREVLAVPAVETATLSPGYGYARLAYFRERADHELKRALDKLEAENGGALKGLMLDLRGNPGGLVDVAVAVADQFLDRGVIISTAGRRRKLQKHYAHPGGTRDRCPLILLVDEGTASAAEILAIALQERGRALLLGTKSFGKGSVQELIELPDGSALKLTTRMYYSPENTSIEGRGVIPDVEVPALPTLTGELDGAATLREQDLEGHFPAEVLPTPGAPPTLPPPADGEAPPTPDTGTAQDAPPSARAQELLTDNQVKAALDYLESWEIFRGLEKAER